MHETSTTRINVTSVQTTELLSCVSVELLKSNAVTLYLFLILPLIFVQNKSKLFYKNHLWILPLNKETEMGCRRLWKSCHSNSVKQKRRHNMFDQ